MPLTLLPLESKGYLNIWMRYVDLLVEFVAFQCKTNLDFDDPDDSNLEMAQDI